jgi:hypothetical protein
VPAPDVEALVERFVRERCRDLQGDTRSLMESLVRRITVQTDSISVELVGPNGGPTSPEVQSRQIVSLPWSKKSFRAEKGIRSLPTVGAGPDLKAGEALLTAIGRARRWVSDLMTGISLADVAKQEGKGERQIRLLIPLAFVPPQLVQQWISGAPQTLAITDVARNVSLPWSPKD